MPREARVELDHGRRALLAAQRVEKPRTSRRRRAAVTGFGCGARDPRAARRAVPPARREARRARRRPPRSRRGARAPRQPASQPVASDPNNLDRPLSATCRLHRGVPQRRASHGSSSAPAALGDSGERAVPARRARLCRRSRAATAGSAKRGFSTKLRRAQAGHAATRASILARRARARSSSGSSTAISSRSSASRGRSLARGAPCKCFVSALRRTTAAERPELLRRVARGGFARSRR